MPKANTFGTFLEALDERPSERSRNEGPLQILKTLEDSSGRSSIQDLMGRLGYDVFEFAQTVDGMKKAGLLEVIGTGPNQVAELTPTGRALAKLGSK